jgi:hypothetical protein
VQISKCRVAPTSCNERQVSKRKAEQVYVITVLGVFCLFVCLFPVLGFELRVYIEPLHQPSSVKGFSEIGSLELFAWARFKPQSS